MPISYDKIVRGSVFEFLVGEEHIPMTIHTALIAEQSSELRKLVSGSMEEAQTGTTTWEDVDEDTFARFAQFVYTGNYPPASSNTLEDSSTPSIAHAAVVESQESPPREVYPVSPPDEPLSDEPEIDSFRYFEIAPSITKSEKSEKSKKGKKEKTNKNDKKGKLKHREVDCEITFCDLECCPPHSPDFLKICQVLPNENSAEDYAPVFLGHARLYALAEKWHIKSLKALVLHRLYATLYAYTPYEDRYEDVVELIRYTYDNTPDRMRIDKLRELVTRYVAYEAIQIAGSEPCLSLAEDCGPFAKDLLSMVLKRVKN